MSNILQSIRNLIKTNNGEFKSPKQALFMYDVLSKSNGIAGTVTSGYNTCTMMVKFDENGITELTKLRKNKNEIVWQKSINGELTSVDLKEIKKYKRRLKSIEKEYNEKIENWNNGNWNGSGDPSTYTERSRELYNNSISKLEKSILNIKEIITNIKNKYKNAPTN